jgi:hypothetical protein
VVLYRKLSSSSGVVGLGVGDSLYCTMIGRASQQSRVFDTGVLCV